MLAGRREYFALGMVRKIGFSTKTRVYNSLNWPIAGPLWRVAACLMVGCRAFGHPYHKSPSWGKVECFDKTMNKTRKGDWFLTYTGKQFWPLDPRPEDVCIEDIAHALANINRFGGHCRISYSVGQHSLVVHRVCSTFQALMHDSAEAYIGDMVRPLKMHMPDFQACEWLVWYAICDRFDIDPVMRPEVKNADNIALVTERRDLMKGGPRWEIEDHYKPRRQVIVPLVPDFIERQFLKEFNLYQTK